MNSIYIGLNPLIIILCFMFCSLFKAQNIKKIEFNHSNAIIIFRGIDVIFEPIENNKKERIKVIVKKDKEDEYVLRISRKKFMQIYSAAQKIKYDTIAVKNNLLDASSTDILIYDELGNRKVYFATGLNKKSKTDGNQKDFWIVTKLILKVAKLQMEDLIGYR